MRVEDPVVGASRQAEVEIAAEPERVYGWISEVEHLGGLGNECQTCRWIEPGALFEGTNRVGDYEWTTRCRVVIAEPARSFGWEVPAEGPYIRWVFHLEPVESGTRLTHAFEVLGRAPVFGELGPEQLAPRFDWLQDGMRQTLDGIKRAIEAAQ